MTINHLVGSNAIAIDLVDLVKSFLEWYLLTFSDLKKRNCLPLGLACEAKSLSPRNGSIVNVGNMV